MVTKEEHDAQFQREMDAKAADLKRLRRVELLSVATEIYAAKWDTSATAMECVMEAEELIVAVNARVAAW